MAIRNPYDDRFPTDEQIAQLKKELAQREAEEKAWKEKWDREHPRRPGRTGPPDRRTGAPDTRPQEERKERRTAATARRTPGSDRRNTKRTTR